MGKPTMWFLNRSDTNQAVQSQKQTRSLKFWIKEEEEVYYPCSENKGDVNAKLICTFAFAYMQIVGFPMRRLKYFWLLHTDHMTTLILL